MAGWEGLVFEMGRVVQVYCCPDADICSLVAEFTKQNGIVVWIVESVAGLLVGR
jgi:hypothetical protein